MRHLVAYFGNEPENLACALFSARAALYVRGEARTVEGYGLGFVQGGDVLLQKRPRAETVEVDLYNLVKDTRAEALIGRVGLAHDGSTPAEDADPFRFRSWLFGSIAELPDATFETIRDKMLEKTPAFLRRNIRGKASSEHLFHLFLAFLHDAGILDQPTPAPAAVHAALRNSLTLVDGSRWPRSAPLRWRSRSPRPTVAASSPPGARTPSAISASRGSPIAPSVRPSTTPAATDAASRTRDCGRWSSRRTERSAKRAGWHEVPNRSALIAGPDRAPQVLAL